jgi:hypothetical protein
MYLEALARATGVPERFVYGFQTELHFPDVFRGTLQWGTFETCYNNLGAGHILTTVAHNYHMLDLRCWQVANSVSYGMETGDKYAERLEMAAVKEGNRTLAVNNINLSISQIYCLWEWC